MKDYNEALEERENEFSVRTTQKVEQLNARYKELHTKVTSLTEFENIPKGDKVAIRDLVSQLELLYDEMDEILAELGAKVSYKFSDIR
jgi:hypothetical protein